MTVSPGTSRKLMRATPKLLLLFAKLNASLLRNVQRVRLPSALYLGNRHSASSSLTPLPSKLLWSRESLADELRHSGVGYPGLDCRCSPRYLANSMADIATIL